jgi:protocatechuate 3,4-dioxygenase beta subunit
MKCLPGLIPARGNISSEIYRFCRAPRQPKAAKCDNCSVPRRLRSITLLVVSTLFAQEKPRELCAISGNVVDALTGAALAKAEVHVEPAGARLETVWPATLTDGKGNFAFAKLDPGEYHLAAERLGYLTTYYGSKRAEQRGPTITLPAGGDLTSLTIRMLPQAVISGTVRESDGEPASNIAVDLIHWTYEGGRRRHAPFRFTRTDDLGQYRFPNVPPGRYDVEARNNFGGQHPLVDRSAEGSPRLLVRLPAMQTGVEVKAGDRISGIDLIMPRGPVFRVAGQWTATAGVSEKPERLLLVRDGDFFSVTTNPTSGGQFEFGSIAPGSYKVIAEAGVDGGVAAVDVVDRDVEGLTVSVSQACEVSGSIAWEGSAKSTVQQPPVSFSGAWWYRFPSAFTGDKFRLRLPPDRYTILTNRPATREWALKAARAGDTDLLADGIAPAGCREMTINLTLTAELGRVEGIATDGNGKPAAGATVVLAPAPKLRSRWDLFDSATADQNGHFLFKGVLPGDYTILAWDDVEPALWHDPEFLKKYEPNSDTVTVTANQTSTIAIKSH